MEKAKVSRTRRRPRFMEPLWNSSRKPMCQYMRMCHRMSRTAKRSQCFKCIIKNHVPCNFQIEKTELSNHLKNHLEKGGLSKWKMCHVHPCRSSCKNISPHTRLNVPCAVLSLPPASSFQSQRDMCLILRLDPRMFGQPNMRLRAWRICYHKRYRKWSCKYSFEDLAKLLLHDPHLDLKLDYTVYFRRIPVSERVAEHDLTERLSYW